MARIRRGQRGFVLIIMTASAIALMGGVGLAVDLGRVFIVKNETQVYVDAAAIAAAQKLEGTSNGFSNANNAVTAMVNVWNLGSTAITGATVDFLLRRTVPGPRIRLLQPMSRSARARVTVTPSLYFLPVVTNVFTQNAASTAVAGQIAVTADETPRGLAPFSGVAQKQHGSRLRNG